MRAEMISYYDLVMQLFLNIGLQQGVITQTLFTMMVLMAIVTTLMASPLFELIYGQRALSVADGAAGGRGERSRA